MCEEFTTWLTDVDVPQDYRWQLAELIRRRENALNEAAADLAEIERQIASLLRTIREYAEALAVWEGEGGQ